MTTIASDTTLLPLSLTNSEGQRVQIIVRKSDGYIDATLLCGTVGKQWNDYNRNSGSKRFLAALSLREKIPIQRPNVAPKKSGGNLEGEIERKYLIELGKNRHVHSWIHPKVAIDLSRWASPEYGCDIADLVYRFQTGQVTTQESIQASHDLAEQVEMVVDDPPDYLPVDEASDIIQYRVDAIHVTNAKNQLIKRVIPNANPQDYAVLANASNQIAMNFSTTTSAYKRHKGIPNRYSIPDVIDEVGLSRRTIAEAGFGNYLIHRSDDFTDMTPAERKADFQNYKRKIHAATDIINPRTPTLLPLPEVKKNKTDVALQRKNGTVKPSLEARALLPLTQ